VLRTVDLQSIAINLATTAAAAAAAGAHHLFLAHLAPQRAEQALPFH
jgi:hypothetical protein